MVSMMDKNFVLLYLEPWIVQAPSKKAGKKGGAAATSKKAGSAAGKVAKVSIRIQLPLQTFQIFDTVYRQIGRKASRRSKSACPI